MRDFNSLSQKEILALAISLEEEDERIYSDFGKNLRENFPGTAQVFEEMRQEEIGHRRCLIELYQSKFGEHIPLIRRQDIRGFAGLMDGSVSTLAPVFAAAFATKNTWDAFAVGLAASLGAGISMGFAEALSDDGSLTGRGTPWLRGLVCGAMTAPGGIGHTLPYLIHDFRVATTIAIIVVLFELATITWVRHRFMDTPPLSAAIQVAFGGALVFATGILIGTS